MTETGPEAAPGSPDEPEGVFGNLPSSRPGSRSPRRRSTQADQEKQDAAAVESEAAPSVAEEPEHEPEPPQPVADPAAPQPSIHGVEDLAWAGVAVVAQAATAGIRFTSKALEAARKSIDRP
jgi:hypothetical protein